MTLARNTSVLGPIPRGLSVVSLGLLVLATPACDAGISLDRSDNWGYFEDWDPALVGEPLATGHAQLAGDFGDSALDAPRVATVEAWHSAGFWGVETSTVDVRVTDADGWVSMGMMEVYGGLGSDELALGTERRFEITDDSPGLFIVFTGCSGLNPDDWTHDDLAQAVTVTVDPTLTSDGLRTVHFEAEFGAPWPAPATAARATTLRGSFQVRPQAPLH